MHPFQAARAERPVGKKTGGQKQQSVRRQQIIRQRVRYPEGDDHADESDNGQANADHCR